MPEVPGGGRSLRASTGVATAEPGCLPIPGDAARERCERHGVRIVNLRWAEPGSRFTALFERVVIGRLTAASQNWEGRLPSTKNRANSLSIALADGTSWGSGRSDA